MYYPSYCVISLRLAELYICPEVAHSLYQVSRALSKVWNNLIKSVAQTTDTDLTGNTLMSVIYVSARISMTSGQTC